jgi:tetratricopeptide (TPR) repeat protein
VNNGKKSGFDTGHLILYFVILLALFVTADNLMSQSMQKPSRQSSLEAFSKGNYEQAYNQFNELLQIYPADPMYKYYSGVCLVKLGRDPATAVILLKQARQSSAAIRSIPGDSQFWLGRALQLSGKFTDAIATYNLYTELNGKKAAKDLGVPEFIRQCERKEGRLADTLAVTDIRTEQEKAEASEEKVKEIPVNETPAQEKAEGDSILADYDKILSEAIELQYKADSIYKIAEEKKKGLEKGSYTDRTKLKAKIAETESVAASLQEQANSKYDKAQATMNKKPFTEGLVSSPVATDTAMATRIYPDTIKTYTKSGADKENVVTDVIRKETDVEAPVRKTLQETVPAIPANPPAKPETVDLYSVFEVKDKAPDEQIEINPSIPKGLIYRIQVAVFRNPVAYSYFKGIVPVKGFSIEGKNLTVYYAGMFRKLADADKALSIVRKKGFKDAFVAALYGGKAVSSEKAAVLEKEWRTKPLTSIVVKQAPADTVPPTLTFRVEVIRSQKPVKDDIYENISMLAGTRGLEIVTLEDKTMVYLIGTFITYESAEEYADLLKRNGFNDAKVGAWLGKKEIPVETARELFERIE